jgi:hypothetical protein
MSSNNITTTLLKKDSTVIYIGEQGKPPVVTAGKLTPDLLFNFENGAYSYFLHKELAADKQVPCVAGGLQDGRVQTWYWLNCAEVDTAGFAKFMKLVRANWLNPGWEQDIKLLILTSSQGTYRVSDWIMLLECTNALIKGTSCELTDAELRNHIQSHVHTNTMSSATHAQLHLILDYNAYKRALRTVDNVRIHTDELLQTAIKQMMTSTVLAACCANPRITYNYSNSAPIFNNTYNAGASSIATTRVPALTTTEHTLLQENDGCFKCRVFYAEHTSQNCPSAFPDLATYRTLSAADALSTKRQNNKRAKTTPSATVLSTPTVVITPTPVTVVMLSSVLSDGTDSDSSYITAPFYTPHFFLDCSVGGSTASSEICICALIDHGLDAVLIDPTLANCLGLRRQNLPKPKHVEMAVGHGKDKESFVFVEWVPLTIISSDQSWVLRTCRAILAPHLCVPLLLGGPFLSLNSLVIDHKSHTCIDKKNGYDLFNPPLIQ